MDTTKYMCAYVMKSHLHGALRENKLILYWLTIMAALPTVKKKKSYNVFHLVQTKSFNHIWMLSPFAFLVHWSLHSLV